ncbi:radical SAM protein [Streptomyces melanogenes]|uniref:Radical SAM protein n=1 Tax=Streptomyces melanogenes TaxID=67326 RepID=A0ABZ1XLP6_9ACTN|nr:radical SAM protein [Streptomyces melanogenes]
MQITLESGLTGLKSLELEITGKCQLACTHCLTTSSPQATHGAMTREDWRSVIKEAAALGIPHVQLIGGEPTAHPCWAEFVDLALSLGLKVEIFSNLYKVLPSWWETFERDGVTLATSYYSNDPDEHDTVTGKPGSYVRTRSNIREAVRRGITLRAGIVDVLDGQHVNEARDELRSMGVTQILIDRVRAVGRAALPGQTPTVDALCGRCARGRAAVLPNGDVAGCVLSRFMPGGNVLSRSLGDILKSAEWAATVDQLPSRAAANPCDPDCNPAKDGGDCSPAEQEACDPAY